LKKSATTFFEYSISSFLQKENALDPSLVNQNWKQAKSMLSQTPTIPSKLSTPTNQPTSTNITKTVIFF